MGKFILSPFTPLFFINRKSDGIESDYMQIFSINDRILIQIIETGTDGSMFRKTNGDYISIETSGEILCNIEWNRWIMNDNTIIWFAELCFNPGIFSVTLSGFGKSEPFQVTDDEKILCGTTLIQYTSKSNRYRNDVVFFVDGMQYYFSWRVPGGFKDSGWTFSAESNQFLTQGSDIVQLSGSDSTQKVFTLGYSEGIPIWYGELLNRILTCTHVYFDGKRYSRKDTSVPEVNQQLEGINAFVFTQLLQHATSIDAQLEDSNHIILREIQDGLYRISESAKFRTI
ncbi:MAG: hypothetical protein K2K81_10215 [Muribaculaceae bacterium]|nr:hypothetical protein [Muribaculaceae bacterium]